MERDWMRWYRLSALHRLFEQYDKQLIEYIRREGKDNHEADD